MHRSLYLILFALAFMAHPGTEPLVLAEDPASPPEDTRARDLLAGFCETLQTATSFQVSFTSSLRVEAVGYLQAIESTYGLAVQRPNRLAVRLERGVMGGVLVYDGHTIFDYESMSGRYSEEPFSGDLQALSERYTGWQSPSQRLTFGFPLFEILLSKDVFSAFYEDVERSEYTGEDVLDGVRCHRLTFFQQGMNWEMWLEADGPPMLRMVRPDFSQMYDGQSKGQSARSKTLIPDVTIRFNDWRIDEEPGEEAFSFTPPEGAVKARRPRGGPEPDEPSPWQGKRAPPFKLPLLDGGELDLAALSGKKVVVLDFWATWCGPCVKALPILAEVTKAYQDRGVEFFAVNVRENPDRIKRFLERKKIVCPVALDTQGKVGDLYEVDGIPQTFIIGRDGVIASVHVGFSPDLRKTLEDDLESVLTPPVDEAGHGAGRTPESEPDAHREAP